MVIYTGPLMVSRYGGMDLQPTFYNDPCARDMQEVLGRKRTNRRNLEKRAEFSRRVNLNPLLYLIQLPAIIHKPIEEIIKYKPKKMYIDFFNLVSNK
jgi:hypothetical protein